MLQEPRKGQSRDKPMSFTSTLRSHVACSPHMAPETSALSMPESPTMIDESWMLIKKAWPPELPGAQVSSSKVRSFVNAGEAPARELLHEAEAEVHPFQTRLKTHSQRRILLPPTYCGTSRQGLKNCQLCISNANTLVKRHIVDFAASSVQKQSFQTTIAIRQTIMIEGVHYA